MSRVAILLTLLLLNACVTGTKVSCIGYTHPTKQAVQEDYEYCVFASVGIAGEFNQCMKLKGWSEHSFNGKACQVPPVGQIPRPVNVYGK